MKKSTKQIIHEYLIEHTKGFTFTNANALTANAIGDALGLSRSIVSQYANELIKDGLVMKIATRPVYFFDVHTLENQFHMKLDSTDFVSLDDLRDYISTHGNVSDYFKTLVGYDGSLSNAIHSAMEVFEYPPYGLPLMLYGQNGVGKMTLARLICKQSAVRGGMLSGKSKVITLEFERLGANKQVEAIERVIANNASEPVVIIINDFDHVDDSTQSMLASLLESRNSSTKRANIHFIFLSVAHPHDYLSVQLQRNIPISIYIPSWKERPYEEREGMVVTLINNEAKVLNRSIQVSSVVLRVLATFNYADNLEDLAKTIRLTCAKASLNQKGETSLILHPYDMPDQELSSMALSSADVSYIDCASYIPTKQIDSYLEQFDALLDSFEQGGISEALSTFNAFYSNMVDKLLDTTNESHEINGAQTALSNIIDIVVRRRLINIPSNFTVTFAYLIALCSNYSLSVERWEKVNEVRLSKLTTNLHRSLVSEAIVVNEIDEMMARNLEQRTPTIIWCVMVLILSRYNTEVSQRKIFGLIICHGYSTASSMASAVNSLIGSYVFESIDMPLDVSIDQIKEALLDKIQRVNRFADVIIMVDMGSLEQIANGLTTLVNKNIGVINNVTTRMVLNVGYRIQNGETIESILDHVKAESVVETKFIQCATRDAIIFTSESGINTAKRMMDLFTESLPEDIPLHYEVVDFSRLLTEGKSMDIFEKNNVLFITGTANPNIDGITYLPLEDIITSENLAPVNDTLNKYLDENQLKILVTSLRRNFTLQNVVQYLTILNPKTLLDYVTVGMDVLQNNLKIHLHGSTLVGIYVHICCLVERLVTKSAIDDDPKVGETFAMDHSRFINAVNESFAQIRKHYNIEIPNNEMAYIYHYIENETKTEGETL